MRQSRKVALVTLGCKLNWAESSTLCRSFEQKGWTIVRPSDKADRYVVNTCSVTEHADKKCRNVIRKLHKISPDARIAVTGCYAQLKPSEILEMEGVDIVVGTEKKGSLPDIVDSLGKEEFKRAYECDPDSITTAFPAYSSGDRTRSFLKVQDGCDFRCSYCTVPIARGHSRSVPVATLLDQARAIAGEGIREIVLTGVNTGDFGRTTGESFLDLLKGLNAVEGIERYRISSIEPNLLTSGIVEWIALGTKFLPHFHIPLQSGCDRILKAMGRRYTSSDFEERISMIRDAMETPQERGTVVFFGIDVIVGFPGETDEDFETTYSFLQRIRPAFIHIFPYSRRAGTLAAVLPGQVQESVKSERVARLEKLCDRLHAEFCRANRGRKAEVLFESTKKGGLMFGYTGNYIRIERGYDASLIGKIVSVTV